MGGRLADASLQFGDLAGEGHNVLRKCGVVVRDWGRLGWGPGCPLSDFHVVGEVMD